MGACSFLGDDEARISDRGWVDLRIDLPWFDTCSEPDFGPGNSTIPAFFRIFDSYLPYVLFHIFSVTRASHLRDSDIYSLCYVRFLTTIEKSDV